jgi:hypothetical protein
MAGAYQALQRFVVGVFTDGVQKADPHTPFANTLHTHGCVLLGFGVVQKLSITVIHI